jgi:hypothetical protein
MRLWDAATGARLRTLEGHGFSVNSVGFSPDGGRIASGGRDKTVCVWDAETGACLCTLKGHTDAVLSVAFSPNGMQLVSGGGWDQTVRVWDAQAYVCLRVFKGHTDTVHFVLYSPDGGLIASGSRDHTVRLWDPKTGAAIRTFTGHTNDIKYVAFSPDGRRVVSGSSDNTVRVWVAPTSVAARAVRDCGQVEYKIVHTPGEMQFALQRVIPVAPVPAVDYCLFTIRGFHRGNLRAECFAYSEGGFCDGALKRKPCYAALLRRFLNTAVMASYCRAELPYFPEELWKLVFTFIAAPSAVVWAAGCSFSVYEFDSLPFQG